MKLLRTFREMEVTVKAFQSEKGVATLTPQVPCGLVSAFVVKRALGTQLAPCALASAQVVV
jgi:hypothetical protein